VIPERYLGWMARPYEEAKMLGSLQENSFYATKQK
jgi:hypothetical protein